MPGLHFAERGATLGRTMNLTTTYVPWTPGITTPRIDLPRTAILKLTDNTNLDEADRSTIGQAVQQAA